ncbi:MAG: CDP-glucose 4,6-dehydratase [Candidatus Doudnabacteria bacterium]
MQNFFQNKKILITGHTGFKGSWLTQILLNWKAKIVGLSLASIENPNLFSILKLKGKIKNHFVDIRDFPKIKNILQKEKPEIVFHLAAQSLVREGYNDPLKTYSTNVLGTVNLLQAINNINTVKSAVIITTDKVYENKEYIYPYREIDALGGYDPYSASKAAADIATQSYIQSFFNPKEFNKKHNTLIAVARAGNVIGGGDWAPDRLIPDIIRAIYIKEKTIIIRNPRAIRPWQHVLEPLEGYLMLAKGLWEKQTQLVGAWNFGPDDASFVYVQDLVKTSLKIIRKGKLKIQRDQKKHEAQLLKLDTTKAKTILGWQPRLTFLECLQFTLDWYKNYYQKPKRLAEITKFTNQQIQYFFQKSKTL